MATLLLTVIVCAFLAGVQSTETIDLDNVWDIEKCPVPNGSCSGLWVGYRMYDRNHLESGQYVEVTDKWNNLTEAGYTSQLPTVVLIHGYANNINYYTLINIKNELLKSYDMFVMFLDWAKLVQSGCYLSAVYNVRYAGRCIADLVEALGRPQKGLHIIGFSLGAHVPASAADFLSPYKIPKITGLDPALPFFFGFPSQRRLRKSDGQFVDAIHTNAFIQGHFLPMGHVDFIVNGGIVQPGCGRSLIDIIMCSHERAPDYYTESINTKVGFWGCKSDFIVYLKDSCKDKDVKYLMGYHADPQLRGVVLLKTASHSPYALGKPKKENFNLNSTSEFIPFVTLIK